MVCSAVGKTSVFMWYQFPGAQAFTGELKRQIGSNPNGLARPFCMVMKHEGEPWYRALGGGLISALEHGAMDSISSNLISSRDRIWLMELFNLWHPYCMFPVGV